MYYLDQLSSCKILKKESTELMWLIWRHQRTRGLGDLVIKGEYL
jgi:hypothetical protein